MSIWHSLETAPNAGAYGASRHSPQATGIAISSYTGRAAAGRA